MTMGGLMKIKISEDEVLLTLSHPTMHPTVIATRKLYRDIKTMSEYYRDNLKFFLLHFQRYGIEPTKELVLIPLPL